VLTPRTFTGVYFEVVTPAGQPLQPGSRGLIQFVTRTHYQHSSGQQRLHVTTIARNFAEAGSPSIAASFDQEAAAVLMARIAAFKAEIDDSPDVQITSAFTLNFAGVSHFLQMFNNSPDELFSSLLY
jgi:protein transport protein SEC23